MAFGSSYVSWADSAGNFLVKRRIRDALNSRLQSEPNRYQRQIDAALLEDEISILCNTQLFARFFREPLREAFPDGNAEARTFLERLIPVRNALSHANPISVRDAERVVCYSHDIIQSLKRYYEMSGTMQDYNVPSFIRFTDSLGAVVHIQSDDERIAGYHIVRRNPVPKLFPGDTLAVEVEVDAAFDPSTYHVLWSLSDHNVEGLRAVLEIRPAQIRESFIVTCELISTRDWQRFGRFDDGLLVEYRILPGPLRPANSA